VDDRSRVAALVGAMLVARSAIVIEGAASQAYRAELGRNLARFRHLWLRRLRNAGAAAGGAIGLGLLLYGYRSTQGS
jgi:hypothetical protein